MAYVNIPRDRDDPNYRYKMPRLYSKIEGRGNGIKTNIANMGEIAKALKRPPMYPTKFFGCELGAQCKYEEAEEKSLVNGAHAEKDLVDILDKFISMYVLCPSCSLPEMDMYVRKGLLGSKCNACGHNSTLDMTHKAATYMIRNPPDAESSTCAVSKKKTKEERKAEKLAKKNEEKDDDDDDNEDAENDNHEKKKKKKKDKEEKKAKKSKSRDMSSQDEEEDGSTRNGHTNGLRSPCESDKTPGGGKDYSTGRVSKISSNILRIDSEEDGGSSVAEKKKKKKDAASNEKLQFNEKLTFRSPELNDITDRLRSIISIRSAEATKEEGKAGIGLTPAEFFHEVRLLQVAQDFDSKVRLLTTLTALFGEEDLTAAAFESKIDYVKKITDSSMRASDVLSTLEFYVNEKCGGKPLQVYPYIIQKIYSNVVLSSESILKYYAKENGDANFTACKKAAAPVLQWLGENDSEEDTDDDDK